MCGASTLLTYYFYVLLQHDAYVLAAAALPGSKAFDFYQRSIRRFFLKVLTKEKERKALGKKRESREETEENGENKETATAEGNEERQEEETKEKQEEDEELKGREEEEKKKKQEKEEELRKEEEEEKENEELVSLLKEQEEKEKEEDVDGHRMSAGDACDLLMLFLVSIKHPDRDFQFLAANVSSLLCLQPLEPQLLRDFSSLALHEVERRPRKEEEIVEKGGGGEEEEQDGLDDEEEEGSPSERKTNKSSLSVRRGEEERRDKSDKERKDKEKDLRRHGAVERMADTPVVYQLHRLINGYKCYMRHPSWKVRSAIVRLSEVGKKLMAFIFSLGKLARHSLHFLPLFFFFFFLHISISRTWKHLQFVHRPTHIGIQRCPYI